MQALCARFGSVNQEVAVPGAKTRGILGWLRRRLGSKSAADPDDDDVQPDVNLSGMLLFQQSPEHHQVCTKHMPNCLHVTAPLAVVMHSGGV